ncbi:MAG: single-stranded DNA-binding protein [Bacillota bacterium]|nr:single-stranded DNA-binding protein [Bacillota bacterium]
MLNKIILKGNLGRDPEIQVTQDGRKIAKFSLATSSSWRDEAREWHEHTDWHQVVVFKETMARWIKNAFKKGDRVYVEGRLMYKHRKDKHGNFHWTTYIIVSEQDGCVEHLRSRHLNLEEEIDSSEFRDNLGESTIELHESALDSVDLTSDSSFDDPHSYQQSQQN